MRNRSMFVGLDVDKERIDVSITESDIARARSAKAKLKSILQ